MATLRQTFGADGGVMGMPRYEDDLYYRVDASTKGNWWIICSLWQAQYCLETGQTDDAWRLINWVRDHASTTGILPEQLSPVDESFVSVAPLAWSQAEYVATLLDTMTTETPHEPRR